MEFVDVVRARRMVRRFDPAHRIERDTLKMLLKLAIRAPSAGHTQGWRFLVLDDITSRNIFWSCTTDGPADSWVAGMRTAPVLIVCYADQDAYLERYAEPDKGWTDRDPGRWPIAYWQVDVGMAALTLLLAAQDIGLGACFFGVPREGWMALAESFSMPARLEPVGVVALGYADAAANSRPLRRRRRTMDEVVTFGGASPDTDSDNQV